ncbi:MAG TPA: bifunctional phosphopantothenoylcysteine decarboxylase/phosphopantothenate--cysteine ligase CoaBC [Symbiobacteriaceae bacterium]|nr:bifunctional phosphopantothenoylcysteine decarboxylase/phosphopantothenate--cysteine ligase CoaBC [Symbiobacteriaceae bacterium]
MELPLQGKTVLLGVSGGIAAYKAVEITSRLVKLGAAVHVLMTPAATKLVAPLTFQAICHNPVMVEIMREQTSGVDHVSLAHQADLIIVAPATANTIANLAGGHAADWIGVCGLAARCPVLICPAMEANMYAAPITQRNLATLANQGWRLMEPCEGRFASGLTGKGRLPEPAEIVEEALRLLMPRRDLAGRKVLVTAGTTREALDPVRYIGNRSTGKMGYAIAEAAAARGAAVTLVTGPSTLNPPAGVYTVRIESAVQMLEACGAAFAGADITIAAAAPADYRPADYHDQKIKKAGDEMAIRLVKNPDIIAELGRRKAPGQVTVAFAAETEHLIDHAREKLVKKNADFVVANDVTAAGAGFGTETNKVSFVTGSAVEELPLMSKREVADRILDKAVLLLGR